MGTLKIYDGSDWQSIGGTYPQKSTFADDVFNIYNSGDNAKVLDFDASNITSGQTRTIIMADRDVDLGSPTFEDVTLNDINVNGSVFTSDLVFGNYRFRDNGNEFEISALNPLGSMTWTLADGGGVNNFVIQDNAAQDLINFRSNNIHNINGYLLVGSATVSPICILDVYRDDTSVASSFCIAQDGTGDPVQTFELVGGQQFAVGIDNSDGDKLKISASSVLANQTAITIDTSKNVGIGTTTPQTLLSLGSSADANKLSIYDNGAGDRFGFGQQSGEFVAFLNSSASKYSWYDDEALSNNLFTIKGTGNVGIGVDDPQDILHVKAGSTDAVLTGLHLQNDIITATAGIALDFGIHTTDTVQNSRIISKRTSLANSDSQLQFWNRFGGSLQQGMVLDENGRLGVGATSPASRLDVRGDIRAGNGTRYVELEDDGIGPVLRFVGGVEGYVYESGTYTRFEKIVRADGGFQDGTNAGIDTTFIDNDGNTITVSGGIITAKTAP